MKYLILLLLSSCSVLTPKLPTLPSVSTTSAPPATKVNAVFQETTNTMWQWVLLSCVLVFVFPSMREPIRFFLSLLFKTLGLPLEHLIMLYNKKYKNNGEEER